MTWCLLQNLQNCLLDLTCKNSVIHWQIIIIYSNIYTKQTERANTKRCVHRGGWININSDAYYILWCSAFLFLFTFNYCPYQQNDQEPKLCLVALVHKRKLNSINVQPNYIPLLAGGYSIQWWQILYILGASLKVEDFT